MKDEKYEKAKKRVKEIKDFYTHLIIFVVVVIVLTIINLASLKMGTFNEGHRFFWYLYPFGFWGFVVLMHGLRTFVFGRGSRWEDRKIKEVMKQMDEDK